MKFYVFYGVLLLIVITITIITIQLIRSRIKSLTKKLPSLDNEEEKPIVHSKAFSVNTKKIKSVNISEPDYYINPDSNAEIDLSFIGKNRDKKEIDMPPLD